MTDKPTLDTNILIYAFGKQDDARKQIAKEIITKCNIISLQVVNETVKIAAQYGFSFWDSMMVASALNNHCSILYSEDLQHSQIIEDRLQIINPFNNLP